MGQFSRPHDGAVLATWICRSGDGGRTWERYGTVEPQGRPDHLVPIGDIVRQDDETLGACFYGGVSPPQSDGYFYCSSDHGRTWEMRGTISNSDLTEATPVVLPNGLLLAASRTMGDQRLELFASDDRGRTWKNRGP